MTTAADRYAVNYAATKGLLVRIGEQLERHREVAAGAPEHWGFVGDLASVAEKLGLAYAHILPPDDDRPDYPGDPACPECRKKLDGLVCVREGDRSGLGQSS